MAAAFFVLLQQILFNMQKAKIILFMLIACIMAACGDSNTRYVKKAVHIMDKNGI